LPRQSGPRNERTPLVHAAKRPIDLAAFERAFLAQRCDERGQARGLKLQFPDFLALVGVYRLALGVEQLADRGADDVQDELAFGSEPRGQPRSRQPSRAAPRRDQRRQIRSAPRARSFRRCRSRPSRASRRRSSQACAAAINLQVGQTFRASGFAKVVAQEQLVVPAGTFDTFRIDTTVRLVNTKDQTKSHTYTFVFWYAPAINRWVKRKMEWRFEGRLRDSTSDELTEYSRAP
jgi:hypothetical protein